MTGHSITAPESWIPLVVLLSVTDAFILSQWDYDLKEDGQADEKN